MNRNLLLALSALFPVAAYSAPVTYNQGDLIMGFRATGGDGVGQYYVVDIGSAATFRDATAPITLSLGDLNADLSLLYTPGWHDRADISWSIVGTPSNTEDGINGDPEDTVYASRTEVTAGVAGTPWLIPSSTNRGNAANQLEAMQDTFFTYEATSNSPGATIQSDSDAKAGNIYPAYLRGGRSALPGLDYGIGYTIEGDTAHTLSLFRMANQSAGSYEGYFSISASGVLTFTPATTTPPPSGYTTWAQTNAGGQGPKLDYDGDGISNGLQYFMGTTTGAAAAHPVPSGGSITWPRSSTAQVTSYKVETSTDLVNWTDVTGSLTTTATSLTYALPAGSAKSFVRLTVDVPQS